MNFPSIEDQKEQLRHTALEADRKYRVVYVGRFFQGSTGIISSLHRALDGLGHTVLPLEPARHKEAFDRSSGAKGGYGPVFFKPEQLDALFQKFRPEVIVFSAGGVVLDEDARRYFRDRGIMTIGLTLSDPDVQDSVINWVDNFDYHATNAQLSYDRYLAEGHRNTFLMPFGIDREYVLREVPEAPELNADAICIGHATGREDRHVVMSRLAELVNVKVYGEGWPLPAETVSGDRLLQAAHGGTFHVNFPATRAGFTNVKCGAFETIGTGSILCTANFDEMGRLFEYGTEIIGYDNAEDLANQIVELKNDPGRLESVRRRSFARLLSEHLYEHRWLQLFDNIELDLDNENGSKSRTEADRLRGIMSKTHGRPRNVIISGFYGARNRGDDLLLDAIADRLCSADPDTNVIVGAVNAKEVEASSGYQAFARTDLSESEKYAAAATATILGAGGLWHDYTIARAGGVSGTFNGAVVSPAHLAQLPLMTRAYGGDFHVFGMGVGPLQDEAARAVIRLTGAQARTVTVRDTGSLELLEGLTDCWPATPKTAPDAVYTLDITHERAKMDLPERYIVLNVRKWSDDPEAHTRIRNRVLAYAQRNGVDVVAVPMQPADVKALCGDDDEYSQSFAAVVGTELPVTEFLDVLGRADAVVSMRLHSNLLAHRLGISAVGFAYDPKVQAHFEELDRRDFVLPLEASVSQIEGAMDRALQEAGLSVDVVTRILEIEDEASAAMDALVADVTNANLQISPISGMVHIPSSPAAKPGGDVAKALGMRIWPTEVDVKLSAAAVTSGNEEDPSREVPHLRKTSSAGGQFQLDVRAPLKGDYVEWSLPIDPSTHDGERIELWIKQKYGEKQKLRGYMEYRLYVDDQELFRHDIVDWNPRNTVWIAKKSTGQTTKIRIRLVALRKCPDWNWGKATSIVVERGRLLEWVPTRDLVWGASSPFSLASGSNKLVEVEKGSSRSDNEGLAAETAELEHKALIENRSGVPQSDRVSATGFATEGIVTDLESSKRGVTVSVMRKVRSFLRLQ